MITLENMAHTTIYSGGDPIPRFWLSEAIKCPQCGQIVHEDNWPPNYFMGMGDNEKFIQSGSVKCICLTCEVQFDVGVHEVTRNDETVRTETFSELRPLTLRNGVYMTEVDVEADDYLREHGEPLRLAFA